MTPFAYWSRRRRRLAGVGAVGVVLVGFIIGRAGWQRWLVSQELARIWAAGEPASAEDLAASYRVSADVPDATAAWQQPLMAINGGILGRYPYGFAILDHEALPPPPGNDWRGLNRAEKYLAKHAALMEQIDRAAATPGLCRYLEDFSGGYQTLLPHVQWMSLVTRLVALRAHVRAHQGDASGAMSDVLTILRAAETLGREPVMVTQQSRLARLQFGVDVVENLLPATPWDDQQLAAIEEALLAIDVRPGLALAVEGERVNGLLAFDDATTAGAGKTPGIVYKALIRDDQVAYLRSMRELLEAVQIDWPHPLQLTEDYRAESIDKLSVPAPLGRGTWAVPSGVSGPLRSLIERAAITTARLRAAATGVAALRFHQTEGRWPHTLEELAPKWIAVVPKDPFTGKPLKMLADDEGLVVYSVGLDGKDDSANEMIEMEDDRPIHTGKPDVVFRVRAGQDRK